ncbi:AbrB family transcriptional regulator [Marinobacterium lacunae]|uniref:AbrB family transcriptional regulator n=1 Tax=Marinobacterium lacunae TaxID=1232683 RepID=UPI0009E09F11
MIGVLLAIWVKVPVSMPSPTTTFISLFMGVSIASSVEADFFIHLKDWSLSIGLMVLMLGVLLAMLFGFYRYRCQWSSSDALLSSVWGFIFLRSGSEWCWSSWGRQRRFVWLIWI